MLELHAVLHMCGAGLSHANMLPKLSHHNSRTSPSHPETLRYALNPFRGLGFRGLGFRVQVAPQVSL